MKSDADSNRGRELIKPGWDGRLRRGMERAAETKWRRAGCTRGANPLLSSAAIVASY
jgi:hypothetical protein